MDVIICREATSKRKRTEPWERPEFKERMEEKNAWKRIGRAAREVDSQLEGNGTMKIKAGERKWHSDSESVVGIVWRKVGKGSVLESLPTTSSSFRSRSESEITFLESSCCVALGFSLGASAAGLQGTAFLWGPIAGHPRGTPTTTTSGPKTRIALLLDYLPNIK